MANISGWMIYPVDDVTGFYCSWYDDSNYYGPVRVDTKMEKKIRECWTWLLYFARVQ